MLANYPDEVKALRAANYQHDLALVAIVDGDGEGDRKRKEQLDESLRNRHMSARLPGERVATPIPTWAIENWLLCLLAHPGVDEARGPKGSDARPTWKDVYEREYGDDERAAIRSATASFVERDPSRLTLPSLTDGRLEFDRVSG
ncbi:hypothetical protein ACNOYE_06765 [Nannocystaceae bacterium ST9]